MLHRTMHFRVLSGANHHYKKNKSKMLDRTHFIIFNESPNAEMLADTRIR